MGLPQSRDLKSVSLFACNLNHNLALPQRCWGQCCRPELRSCTSTGLSTGPAGCHVSVSRWSVSYGQCLLTCDLQEQFLHLCAAPAGAPATESSSCRCCLRAKCLGHFICIIQSNRATGTADQIALNHVGCDHYKQKTPKHCKGFFVFNFFNICRTKMLYI